MADAVEFLATGFEAGVPLRPLLDLTTARYGSTAWSCPEKQKLLARKCFSDSEDRVSIGRAREKTFLRLLFDELDRLGCCEIAEELSTAAVIYSCPRNASDRSKSYIRFEGHLFRCSNLMSDVGMRLWDAGVALSNALSIPRNVMQSYCRGRRVLEIGAGLGVTEIGYRRAEVSHSILTEIGGQALENLRHNVIELNHWSHASVQPLDVTDPFAVKTVRDEWNVDVVIAADLCYDESLVSFLVKAYAAILTQTDRLGFIILSCRNDKTVSRLIAVRLNAELCCVEMII